MAQVAGAGPLDALIVSSDGTTKRIGCGVRELDRDMDDRPALCFAGELVTETLDYDGGRPVTVFVPPDPPQAVVFAADGQGVAQWGRVSGVEAHRR